MSIASLQITMPYEPKVSVNAAHYQGRQSMTYVPEAQAWLLVLKNAIVQRTSNDEIPPISTVSVEIRVFQPKGKGRTADCQNFVKHPIDTIASTLGIDDTDFKITTYPTKRGEDPHIELNLEWEY